ncbi:MAG: EAL domain-containing protein, partial [Pseudomonadota bacterium]|nr:EAL domain-containing protein [Pseudomonadota bacterium]
NIARNFGDRIAVALSNAAWEEKLYNQAHYDGLTGLANRRVLNEYLTQALARAKRDGTSFCLLFIELDRFKNINDSMGHATGDRLLVEVASRLKNHCRDTDLAVRMSGDEFVILLTDFDDNDASIPLSSMIAEKILAALSTPYQINNQTLHISASIGIAIYPEDGHTPEAIIEHADAAMYHAKAAGRANFHFYQPAMTSKAVENMRLEHDLRQAIEKDELVIYYQPKFDSQQEIVGAEALIRWMHPELGMVSPAKFIPIAEQSLLIIDIGRWVFEQCCSLINELRDKNLSIVPIAVNLSAVEFNRDDLIPHLLGILDKTQTNPNSIELELTESVALANKELCIQRMNALRASGMSLAMDDFGTGFSSLSYLQELPLNTLKIDQQFVKNIELGESSQAIVKAVMALAKGLSMSVVAEGVETREQFNFLAEHGCDFYQGYLLSKPIPKVDFMAKLEAEKYISEHSESRHQ